MNFFKRILFFIFGCLAVVFGITIIIWILYNIVEIQPEFRDQVGDNKIISVIKIIAGLVGNVAMVQIGKEWIVKSEMLKFLNNFNKNR